MVGANNIQTVNLLQRFNLHFTHSISKTTMSFLARFIRPTTLASTSRLPTIPTMREFSVSSPILDKLKSHSGTKKRFFRTGSGLVSHSWGGGV